MILWLALVTILAAGASHKLKIQKGGEKMNDRILPYAEEAAVMIVDKCLHNRIAQVGIYLAFKELPDRMVLYDIDMDAIEYRRVDILKAISPQNKEWWVKFATRAAKYYEGFGNFGAAIRVEAIYFRYIDGRTEIIGLNSDKQ